MLVVAKVANQTAWLSASAQGTANTVVVVNGIAVRASGASAETSITFSSVPAYLRRKHVT